MAPDPSDRALLVPTDADSARVEARHQRTASFLSDLADLDPSSPEGRVGLLTRLHRGGAPTHLAKDRVPAADPPHRVVAVGALRPAGRDVVELFVAAEGALDSTLEGLGDALDVANGLVLRSTLDASVLQIGAALRVACAAGLLGVPDGNAIVSHLRVARADSPDLDRLPDDEELQGRYGSLMPGHFVRLAADPDRTEGDGLRAVAAEQAEARAGALDVRLARCCALGLQPLALLAEAAETLKNGPAAS